MIIRSSMLVALTFLAAVPGTAPCQQPIPLIDAAQDRGGWEFDNGREFPGARGGLKLADEQYRDQPVLALHGDFTRGGNYVQAAIELPEVPVERLSFWVNAPAGSASIPVRLIDATGQCHQLRSASGGVTLTLSDDPLLLLYDGKESKLAESLGDPHLSLDGQPGEAGPGDATTLSFVGNGLDREKVGVIGPPLWKTQLSQVSDKRLEVRVEAPSSSTAREARIRVQLLAGDDVVGELQVSVSVAQAGR